MGKIKKLYFICGEHGVGKSYLCHHVAEMRTDVMCFDCGPTVRKLHKMSNTVLSLSEWIKEGNQTDPDQLFIEKAVLQELQCNLQNNEKEILLIIGCRSLEHIFFLANGLNIRDFLIIYITCDQKTQTEHLISREGKSFTKEDLLNLKKHDIRMGLEAIKKLIEDKANKNCIVIDNNPDCDAIRALIDVIEEKVYEGTE